MKFADKWYFVDIADDDKLDDEDTKTTFDEIDSLENNQQSFNTDDLKAKTAGPCLCNVNTNVLNQYIAAYLHDQPGKLYFSTLFSISLLVFFWLLKCCTLQCMQTGP